MSETLSTQPVSQRNPTRYGFRPWVRRAGWSIVLVAAFVTLAIVLYFAVEPTARFGWVGERFVWLYLGTLWLGGLKIALGTRACIAELNRDSVVLRPLHALRAHAIRWEDLRGSEQMIGGDRLIVYYDTPKGVRYVALNLNLVKGRREFLTALDQRLRSMGFVEKIVERSRYLTKAGE